MVKKADKLVCSITGKSLNNMGFEQLMACISCEKECDAMKKIISGPSQRRVGMQGGK